MFICDDAGNHGPTDTKFFGERCLSTPSSSIFGSNIYNLTGGELGVRVRLPLKIQKREVADIPRLSYPGPALLDTIQRVVALGSLEQMLPANARGPVAGVAHQERIWIDAVVEEVSHAVSLNIFWLNVEFPVTLFVKIPRPLPALPLSPLARSLIHVVSESINIELSKRWKWFTLIVSHLISPTNLLVRAARLLDTAPWPDLVFSIAGG